jgi:hypothetical protein
MSSTVIERPTDITVPASGLWAKMPMIAGGIGAVGTLGTIAMMFGEHKDRAFFAYLFAFMTVLSIALASLGFVLIQHVTRAGWSAVVRRIAEASAATLPIFAVLFIPIAFLGFHSLYPWSHESDNFLEAKRWWLGATLGNGSSAKFLVRAALYLGIWAVLGQLLWRKSVSLDGLIGNAAETEKITHSMWKLSAGGVFLFALSLSFAAVDWMMSLQPHWYSTMYGVYYFAGAMVGFYAFLALAMMAIQKGGMLKTAITTEHYHDVGKFTFGHTVFWAYITFCQFMLIWFANIPEETEFYMVRMEGGWDKISLAFPIIHFFIPFLFLLSRHVKRSRVGLAIGAAWILVVHTIDIFWNIMPNQGAHGAPEAHGAAHGAAGEVVDAAEAVAHHANHFSVQLVDVLAFVGIAGLFLAAFSFLLKKGAVVCINDPRLEESLKHENY